MREAAVLWSLLTGCWWCKWLLRKRLRPGRWCLCTLAAWAGVIGVWGCSWVGVPIDGDFGGELLADFVGFLKNFDVDLLVGGGRWGEGREPSEGERKRGWVAEADEDCGDSVSPWGNEQ